MSRDDTLTKINRLHSLLMGGRVPEQAIALFAIESLNEEDLPGIVEEIPAELLQAMIDYLPHMPREDDDDGWDSQGFFFGTAHIPRDEALERIRHIRAITVRLRQMYRGRGV